MKLVIQHHDLEQIVEHARQGYPYEVCGLVGGREGVAEVVIPVPNSSLSPREHFEMEPQAMVDAVIRFQRAGREVVAIYHSHPGGKTDLSTADVAKAGWSDVVYLVVGLNEQQLDIGAWTIQRGEVMPAELEIVQPG